MRIWPGRLKLRHREILQGGTMARKKESGRLDDRLVVLVDSKLKADLLEMYTGLNQNMSEDTRDFWKQKLELYKANKNG